MKVTHRSFALLTFMIFLLTLVFPVSQTAAQVQDDRWSPPYRLTSEGGQLVGQSAVMVADSYGFVHVLWIEASDSDRIIQYARFDGQIWSNPVDIFVAAPDLPIGEYLAVTLDQNGILHANWTTEVGNNIYYTSAPAHDALSAQKWQTPAVINVPAHQARLHIDSRGTLHLVYSNLRGSRPGVFYQRSNDEGLNWSEPIWLDPDVPLNQGPNVLQFLIDENNGLHVAWYYVRLDASAAGTWLRYIHSPDAGNTWFSPVTIDRVSAGGTVLMLPYPNMSVQGSHVHIIWAGGDEVNAEGVSTYRKHRWSADAGQTWYETTNRVFGSLYGQAQGDGLAIDSAGRLHFIGQIRYPQGLYHTSWDRGAWSTPALFYRIDLESENVQSSLIHAHGIRLAVRAGNQLVTTFYDRSDTKPPVLYAMHRTLDDVDPAPISPTPSPKPTSEPTSTPPPSTPLPTPAGPAPGIDNFATASSTTSPGGSLWIGVAPALLLILGSIAFQFFNKR